MDTDPLLWSPIYFTRPIDMARQATKDEGEQV